MIAIFILGFAIRQVGIFGARLKSATTARYRDTMDRLMDKIVLITGAAGAVGAAVTQAVRNAGGVAITSDLNSRNGIDYVLDVASEPDWQQHNFGNYA